jgi:HK97 family phage portal protein
MAAVISRTISKIRRLCSPARTDLAQRSSLDNPEFWRDPYRWDAIWNDSYETEAGIRMTASRALQYSPVWAALSLVSGDVAKLPLELLRRRPDRGPNAREVAKDHPAWWAVARRPHQSISAFDFWRRMMVHVMLWNHSYAALRFTPDSITMLPLLPDRTEFMDELRSGVRGGMYVTEINGELKWLFPSEVLHLNGITIDGHDLEVLQSARHAWALGLARQGFASKFFRRGGRIGGILEVPAEMKKIARDNLEDGFRKSYENVDAAFLTVVLRDNAKFHSAQHSFSDTQLVESAKEGVKDVARYWVIPPHKLGDDSRTAYNSLEQENKSYLESTLSPWLCTIVSECWMKLLSNEEKKRDQLFFQHDTSQFLATDVETVARVQQIRINMGVMNPNEVRSDLNMPPREGGDEYHDIGTPEPPEPEGPDEEPDDQPEDEPDEDDGSQDRARQLTRVLAKIVEQERGRKSSPRFQQWCQRNLPPGILQTLQETP